MVCMRDEFNPFAAETVYIRFQACFRSKEILPDLIKRFVVDAQLIQ